MIGEVSNSNFVATSGMITAIAGEIVTDRSFDEPIMNKIEKDIEMVMGDKFDEPTREAAKKELLEFIIDKYAPQRPDCHICPACLSETPSGLAICLSRQGEFFAVCECRA